MSINQLLTKKRKEINFDGEWFDLIGHPEVKGLWLIWGQSGQGKTRFALQLTKYLALKDYKVAYISLEEGDSKSLSKAFLETGVADCQRKIVVWYEMIAKDIIKKLNLQRSPQIVFIDSLQHLRKNYAWYIKLKERFPKKLFIIISHANENNKPDGKAAKSVHYDAFVKIQVKDFIAYATSRYGGGTPFTIWSEGAKTNNKS